MLALYTLWPYHRWHAASWALELTYRTMGSVRYENAHTVALEGKSNHWICISTSWSRSRPSNEVPFIRLSDLILWHIEGNDRKGIMKWNSTSETGAGAHCCLIYSYTYMENFKNTNMCCHTGSYTLHEFLRKGVYVSKISFNSLAWHSFACVKNCGIYAFEWPWMRSIGKPLSNITKLKVLQSVDSAPGNHSGIYKGPC